MQGIMDALGGGYDDPRTQGLLTLGLQLLASRQPRFGQALGEAGMGAMQAYQGARQAQQQRETVATQQQMAALQLAQAKAQAEKQRQLAELAQRSARSPQQVAMAANGGPTVAAATAAADPAAPPGFDWRGYQQGLAAIDPMAALQVEASLRKDDSPLSVKEGETLLDRRTLKPVFANPKPADLPSTVREFQFGQANPAFNPWLTSRQQAGSTRVNVDAGQRFENAYSTDQGKAFSATMNEINKAGFAAPQQLRKLERMEQLLKGVDGGKLSPMGLEVASALNSLGIKVDPKLGNKEASQALARELAGGLRQPGTGPMTDKDFDNFLLQIPDLSKTSEGRAQITATMRAALNRDMAIARMARDYERRNGRLDNGFFESAAQFIAENPVVSAPQGWKVDRGGSK